MHFHSLDVSPAETTPLWRTYQALTGQLDKGGTLEWDDISSMEEQMAAILMRQPGLMSFWQQVSSNPYARHYLHLVHADKEILNLPWQLAIDNRKYPFVYISKGLPDRFAEPYKPQVGKLKILVMIASPDDLTMNSRLSYEEEEESIQKALAPLWEKGEVMVDFTEYGSLQSLQEHLRQQHYNILYISGHGAYHDNTGFLLLENQDTLLSEEVTANDFASTITGPGIHIPALVILNSCQTAQASFTAGFTGVADALMQAGVPAAIAMAFSITDRFAIVFATHLFNGLASRDDLPGAYGEALKAMKEDELQYLDKVQRSSFLGQWLIPQLYCSREVKEMIDWFAAEESNTAPTARNAGKGLQLLQEHHSNYQFIGRRREYARLFKTLLHQQPVLLLGQGGVGKTSLAEHLVKRLHAHDATIYCLAFNETNIGINAMVTALEDCLRKRGGRNYIIESNRYDSAVQRLTYLLEKATTLCRPVWVFDNMESCQQGPGGRLREVYTEWLEFVKEQLLHRYPVIFTSRYPIAELPELFDCSLNQVSFIDFYRKCLQLQIRGIQKEVQTLSLWEVAHILFKALGGNYRMLEVFDEIYKNERSQAIALLQQLQGPVEQPGKEGRLMKVIATKVHEKLEGGSKKLILGELLRLADRDAQGMLGVLLYFDRPILLAGLEKQRPTMQVLPALQKLKALTLIEEQPGAGESHYYYVTPLVRDWLENIQLPVVDFSHRLAGAHFETDNKQVADNHFEDLKEAFRHYEKTDDSDRISEVGLKLIEHHYEQGLFHQALVIAQQVEKKAGHKTAELVFTRMGLIYRSFGKYDLALQYLKKSLTEKTRAGWNRNEEDAIEHRAVIGIYMGRVCFDIGNYDHALRHWEHSRDVLHSIGNFKKQSEVLIDVSEACIARGDLQQAMELMEESRNIRIALQEKPFDERVTNLNGLIAAKLGQHGAALEYFEQSLNMHQALGRRQGEAAVLSNMGEVYMCIGEFDQALECFETGLKLAKALGEEGLEMMLLTNIGNVYRMRGDYNTAMDLYNRCFDRQQKMREQRGMALTLNNIGKIHFTRNEHAVALQAFKKSLSIVKSIRDRWSNADILLNIACVYGSQRRNFRTLLTLRKCLSISRSTGHRVAEAGILYTMAIMAQKRRDLPRYFTYAKKAYEIFDAFNAAMGIYQVGKSLSAFYFLIDNAESQEQGITLLRRCYAIAQKAGLPEAESIGLELMKYPDTSTSAQTVQPDKALEVKAYLIRNLEKEFEKAIHINIANSTFKGTTREGIVVSLVVAKASEAYKKIWTERINEPGITPQYIESVVDEVAQVMLTKYGGQ